MTTEKSEIVMYQTDDGKTRTLETVLVDALADILITDCKSYYIQEHLRLPIENEICRHAFLKALSTFDCDTDKIIAKTLIELTPKFLLDSFYEFKIEPLKNRWNEVCMLANENISYLVCASTFSELLRFLISNIEPKSEEVHLVMRGSEIEVLGRGLKPLKPIYINESLPPDVQVVTKLVAIAPKRVFFHQTVKAAGFSDTLVKNIQSIFPGCVVIK